MGNCCGGDYAGDFAGGGGGGGGGGGQKQHTSSGGPPAAKVMTPDEDQRREQARKAAEERARQNSVRGTQRYTPKRKPKTVESKEMDKGGPDISVAARVDTDHIVGPGQVSITGKYDTKRDSFGIDTSLAVDDNNTLYASYTVTDERLSSLGLETGFTTNSKRVTIDTTYFPPSDSARCKLLIRQGKIKAAATWQFSTPMTSMSLDDVKNVKYDLESKVSAIESVKLGYDTKTKATKVKYGRKLDAKNKLDMEYNYAGMNVPAGRPTNAFSVKLSHSHSPKHSFSTAFNYGTKKIATEWEWKTDKGPWTVNAAFPFNASPKSGDLSIKRRFEF